MTIKAGDRVVSIDPEDIRDGVDVRGYVLELSRDSTAVLVAWNLGNDTWALVEHVREEP
jgi:hypothetical protein